MLAKTWLSCLALAIALIFYFLAGGIVAVIVVSIVVLVLALIIGTVIIAYLVKWKKKNKGEHEAGGKIELETNESCELNIRLHVNEAYGQFC